MVYNKHVLFSLEGDCKESFFRIDLISSFDNSLCARRRYTGLEALAIKDLEHWNKNIVKLKSMMVNIG